jgi:ABC-2 type transport system ATP-binding protein
VVALGSPAELTRAAAVDEVVFTSTPALPTDDLARALGLEAAAVREARPGEYVIAAAGKPALVADLAVWLRDRDLQLDELHTGRRTLEDVFLRLTSERAT